MHERYPQAANGSFSGVIRTIDGAEVYYRTTPPDDNGMVTVVLGGMIWSDCPADADKIESVADAGAHSDRYRTFSVSDEPTPDPPTLDPSYLPGATIDATQAVVAYLAREWGVHGYRTRIVGDGSGGARCHVSHGDGSKFTLRADAYGNIRHRADIAAHDAINELIGQLHTVAIAAWVDKEGYAKETIDSGATNPQPGNLQYRERLIWDMIDMARRLNEIVD